MIGGHVKYVDQGQKGFGHQVKTSLGMDGSGERYRLELPFGCPPGGWAEITWLSGRLGQSSTAPAGLERSIGQDQTSSHLPPVRTAGKPRPGRAQDKPWVTGLRAEIAGRAEITWRSGRLGQSSTAPAGLERSIGQDPLRV
jgi:hypothetical protein